MRVSKKRLQKIVVHNLKKLRKMHKYTQGELADLAGITRAAICNYEKGFSLPCLTALIKFSYIFNVTVDSFLNLEIKEIKYDEKAAFLYQEFGDILTLNDEDYRVMKVMLHRLKTEKIQKEATPEKQLTKNVKKFLEKESKK